jgi:hypothetical protein
MKNIMYKTEEGAVVPNDDFLLQETSIWRNLPRNMREWLAEADEMQNGNLTTVKLLYSHFLENRNHKPRVESAYPQIDWETLWKNLSFHFLPTDWRASVFMLVNDAIPNVARLRRHQITSDNPVCVICNNEDDNIHRIKLCAGATLTWNWLTRKLNDVLRLDIDDPEELLVTHSGKKEQAGLWLTIGVMHFNLKNYKTGKIQDLENMLRRMRWSKRHILEKFFGNLLNIF